MSRQTLPRLPALIAISAMVAISSARAAAPLSPADLVALTGVSTSESEALDKEADKLVEDSIKAKADADAASRAGSAKIDTKKLADALKRGDKGALAAIDQMPEFQHASQLRARAEELAKQAYQKAEESASKRARAALEQRCIAPSSASGASAPAKSASSYLCSAVHAPSGAIGQNDPWELCSCMRRYLTGLQKDYDELQSRVQSFIGKDIGREHPVTAEDVDQDFKHSYGRFLPPNRPIESATNSFELDARGIEKDAARGRIRQALGGTGFVPSSFDTFLLSRGSAYQIVLGAEGELWKLYQIEARWHLGALRQENDARRKTLSEAFSTADDATMAKHPEYHTQDDATGFVRDMEPLARQNDQRDYVYIEQTAQGLRSLVDWLGGSLRRFTDDANDWTNYAAKDGQAPHAEWPVTAPEPIDFEIDPSRYDPVHCCLRLISKGDQLFDDPETHVWAHFPQNLLDAHPEMKLSGEDPNWQVRSPRLILHYDFEKKDQPVTAVSSGAGSTESP